MTVYSVRINRLGIFARVTASVIGVVLLQGILSLKFGLVAYFDLPLVCTVYYGFIFGNPVASIVIGSSLGLMQDSLSAVPLGINGLSKTVIGFLAARAGAKFAVDEPIPRVLALFLFTVGDSLLVTILVLMVDPARNTTYSSGFSGWLLCALFNTVLGLVSFALHDRRRHATA